jgi:hypothetical protein
VLAGQVVRLVQRRAGLARPVADAAGEPVAVMGPRQALSATISKTMRPWPRWDSPEERQHLTTVVNSRR